MAEFKVVINDPKTGKAYQQEAKEDAAAALTGMKIGDTVSGDIIGLAGYELVITGGSDDAGFPMRRDVTGTSRKRILAIEGVGLKKLGHGQRQRKTVSGNTISQKTAQVNLKVMKYGKAKLGGEEEKPQEEAPAQA